MGVLVPMLVTSILNVPSYLRFFKQKTPEIWEKIEVKIPPYFKILGGLYYNHSAIQYTYTMEPNVLILFFNIAKTGS